MCRPCTIIAYKSQNLVLVKRVLSQNRRKLIPANNCHPKVFILDCVGQRDQSTNEDAPLVNKKGDPIHHQGGSDIELSPSTSPQSGSPVHVQFSPNDHEYHAMAGGKREKDS
jgi:hypothetical protein